MKLRKKQSNYFLRLLDLPLVCSLSFFWKNKRYTIGKIPRVLIMKMQMNHAFCFLFPLFHNAIPFHTDSQTATRTNIRITDGVIPQRLYNGLINIVYTKIDMTNLNTFCLYFIMQNLLDEIKELQESEIKKVVDNRMREFEELGNKDNSELFKELCFCLLTANFSAHGGIKIQNALGDRFSSLPQEELAKKLSELGHRFPNMRAKFIFEARKYKDNLKETLKSFECESDLRNWIAENVKGLGMKESSHFLRNIGYKNLAIIDFHIIDLLVKNNLIQQPKSKSLTKKNYVEIENILKEIAKKSNTNLGELDLYLWYKETGKILK